MKNFRRNLDCFVLVSLITVLPAAILDFLIFDEIDYFNYFSNWVPEESIEEFVGSMLKWRWMSYPFSMLTIAIKTLLVAGMIWLAIFLGNRVVSFGKVWVACLKAQMVFAIRGYILLVEALLVQDFRLENLQEFHPLSLANLFEGDDLQPYWSFVLQSINLFEVAYWFILGYFLARLFNSGLNDGLRIVASSYIPGFTIWLTLVTFLLVSNS